MKYCDIKNCDRCPIKINGFCQGSHQEKSPMCLQWTPDTDIDRVLINLLFNEEEQRDECSA